MRKEILTFGSSGLIGSNFLEQSQEYFSIKAPSSREVDLLNPAATQSFVENSRAEAVINFAAFTDVDGAEKEKGNKEGKVYQLNVITARNLAQICKKQEIFLLHISTGFVFTGTEDRPGPYSEDILPWDDEVNLGSYAQTKLWGEQEVRDVGGRHAIVRLDYPFIAHFSGKTDFARNILTLYDQNKLYPLFSDQYIRLAWGDQLSQVLQEIIKRQVEGVFHYASVNTATPFSFGSLLLERARGVKDVVNPATITDFKRHFPHKSPRPQYGGLECRKTQEILGMRFMTWEEQIEEFVKKL